MTARLIPMIQSNDYGRFRVQLLQDTLAVPLQPAEVAAVLEEMAATFPQIERGEIDSLKALGDHWRREV
jgi:hypothetical protein